MNTGEASKDPDDNMIIVASCLSVSWYKYTGLCVVPKQRLQVFPPLRVAIQVCHRVEHSGLDRLSAMLEEPHDRAPRERGEKRECFRVGREGLDSARSGRSRRIWVLCARQEGCDDTGDNIEDNLREATDQSSM